MIINDEIEDVPAKNRKNPREVEVEIKPEKKKKCEAGSRNCYRKLSRKLQK